MRRPDIQSGIGEGTSLSGIGEMFTYDKVAPINGQVGWGTGAMWVNTVGVPGTILWTNIGSNGFGSNATSQWINIDSPDGGLVSLAVATVTLTATLHAGRTLLFNTVGGVVATLPAATGTGNFYRFVVQTLNTGASVYEVSAAGSDKILGTLAVIQPGGTYATANQAESFLSTASSSVTIGNATGSFPTGGANIGDWFQVQDIAAAVWAVTGSLTAGTTPTKPFS